MNDLFVGAIRGAAAGFAATAPMTAFMMLAHRELPPEQTRPLPPREITHKAAAMAGAHDALGDGLIDGLAAAGHFSYGAATGALYGAVARGLPLPPVASG